MKYSIAAVMLAGSLFVAGCGGEGLASAKMPEVGILQVEGSITFSCRTIEFTDVGTIGARTPHTAETLNFLYKKIEEWKKTHPEWICKNPTTDNNGSYCRIIVILEKAPVQAPAEKTAAN